MAEFPAMPLWTDAYLADTKHLSDAEHGRYLLLLMDMWRAPGRRFPNDKSWLARKFSRSPEVFDTEIQPLLEEFCQCDGNWWTQKKLRKVWNKVQATSVKQSARAKSARDNDKPVSRGSAAPAEQPKPKPKHIEERDAPTVHLARRASRLPNDWEPDGQQREYAERYGLDADRVAADFRDYWCAVPGQRGLKLDWSRTWQTRCRELADRQARDLFKAKGNGHARRDARQRPPSAEQEFWRRHSGDGPVGSGPDPDVAEDTPPRRR